MPPSALLALVGPRVANHVHQTLHAAFPERIPLSPMLQSLADGELDVVITGDDRKTIDEIHEQLLEAFVDEARHLLEEGVVSTAAEIDGCLILGAGFPFFRGGITKHLDQSGVSERVLGRTLASFGDVAHARVLGQSLASSRSGTPSESSRRGAAVSEREKRLRRGGREADAFRVMRARDPRKRIPISRVSENALAEGNVRLHCARIFEAASSTASIARARHLPRSGTFRRVAPMQEVTLIPTMTSDSSEELAAAATRAEAWFGEPFLHSGEDASVALAPGTARRAALDDALAEMAAGREAPTPRWKVRYGLMLGLERVLATAAPETSTGTELRRHQIDALTGMLTELIAATQRSAEENGNGGNGHTVETFEEPRSSRTTTTSMRGSSTRTPPTAQTTETTRVPRAATASGTRPRPARRSPPPGSWRRPAGWACSSSPIAGCSSRSSSAI